VSSTGSVTHWLEQLRAGDQAVIQQLWKRYFRRLVALAREKLHGTPRRAADEEDVALSAFDSFCRGMERGQFLHLFDRNDLWQLLLVITCRKAIDLMHHERRRKRGGGTVVGESELRDKPTAAPPPLEQILSREPSPELAAEVAEECQRLLDSLGNTDLRTVALWKMEGYTNEQIAAKLGCVPRTVERKLQVIRSLWTGEMGP
jgi:DNA-directed RNA polymerase specialized sigma24 family protein